MLPDVASDILGSWIFWMGAAVVSSLVWFAVTTALPGAARRRAMQPPRPETKGDARSATAPVHHVESEVAMVSALTVHHDRIVEAHNSLTEARLGTPAERAHSLDRAELLLDEAMAARPDSPDAAELMAHVHHQRFELAEDAEQQEAWLRRAADWFLRTTELRPSDVDPYLGSGATWIELAYRWTGPQALEAFDIAAAAYEKAFPMARNNVNLMKGWGIAIDGLHAHRMEPDGEQRYEARRAAFEDALGRHRGGNHDLNEWFDELLRSDRRDDPPAFQRL
jgi:hypothetical protein